MWKFGALGLAMLASACVANAQEKASANDNVNQAGLTLAMCGTVDTYEAPKPAKDGTLAMDGRRWTILPNAVMGDPDLLVEGVDVCIKATMDVNSRIERCAAEPRTP